jgi:hypothetical protein
VEQEGSGKSQPAPRVWLSAVKRLDWGVRFWRFALAYVLVPWVALGACLRMRRDERPWPLLLRVSHFAVNYVFAGLQVAMIWLWIRLVLREDWFAVAILPFPAVMNFLVLAVRLQTVYMLSRETPANE